MTRSLALADGADDADDDFRICPSSTLRGSPGRRLECNQSPTDWSGSPLDRASHFLIPTSRAECPFAWTRTLTTIRSVRAFQLFLLRIYYLDTGESPGAQAIRAAAELFEARALFDGQECPVHLRVAEHGGRLYLDLCDRAWRAVEIDAEGWRMVDRPPAKFRRTRGSQPLPEPGPGGSLEELRSFFNVDHHGWILIRAFLVAALRPGFPLPILVAKGEQGAGKSTACRVISSLIDPRTSALRGVAREVRDLIAAARNSWLVVSIT